MARLSEQGKVAMLRVNEAGGKYGPDNGGLEADVLFRLDTSGETTYGFQMRSGDGGRAQYGMFLLLKEAHLRELDVFVLYDEHDYAHRCVRVVLGGAF